MKKPSKFDRNLHVTLLVLLVLLLIWSMINPRNWLIWFAESIASIIGVVILISVYKRFRLSNFTYVCLFLLMVLTIVGAHYTYSHVPLFDWIKNILNSPRNDFDRLTHFMLGLIAAVISREFLMRTSSLRKGKWLAFNVVCIALAAGAFYELIEWSPILFAGVNNFSNNFMASQGDIWDTHWDMFYVFLGALFFSIFLSGLQDKSIKNLR